MPYFFYDQYYVLLVVPTLLLALWAQWRVNTTFNKYSRVPSARGLTGAMAARQILDANGLMHIRVEHIRGSLTDHFDPRAGVIRLSDSTYQQANIAAVGVAAHEAGHAVQHAVGYGPIKIRTAIIPITNFGSNLAIPLILLGFFLQLRPLVLAGVLLYSLVAIFQLVTLPVEFNASSRAIATLEGSGMLYGDEVKGARKVLSAAAMTYVAALVTSLAQLLRLILLANRRRD